MNPFARQNKEIREFKLPAKMILFNGQVPQKGDIVQIDLGEISMKKSRVEDLYFRMINGELVATVHMSYGYTNQIYAVSINTVTGMMLSYWYDKSKCDYNSRAFNLYNENGTSMIQISSKNINLGITGAFSSMTLSSNTKKLQVQYYDNSGELHYDNVSVLKAKDWSISKFDTFVDFPAIKGNYVTKEEALQNMSINGTQLCTVTSERKEETEIGDKSQNKIMSPKKRLMKLPNDTFSYDELYQSIEGDDKHRKQVIRGLIQSNHIIKTDDSNHFIKAEYFRLQKEQEPTVKYCSKYKKVSPQERLAKFNNIFTFDELYLSIEGDDTHRMKVIDGLKIHNHIIQIGDNNTFKKNIPQNIDEMKVIPKKKTINRINNLPSTFTIQDVKNLDNDLTYDVIMTWKKNGYVTSDDDITFTKSEQYLQYNKSLQETTLRLTTEEMHQEKETKDVEYEIFDTPVQFNRVSSYADYLKKVPDYFSRKDLMNEFNITLEQVRGIVYNLRKRNYITYCNDQDHFLKTERYRKNYGSLSPQSVTKEEEKPVTVTPVQQEPQQLQAPITTEKPQPAKEDIVELGEKIGLVTVSIDIFSGDTNETRLQRLIDTYNNNVKKFSI